MSPAIMMKALALALVFAATSAAADLKVLTYNIRNGAGRTALQIGPFTLPFSRGHSQLDDVAEVIRKSGADIVLLQEVEGRCIESLGQDQARYLAKKLGFHHAYFTASEGGFGIFMDKGNAVMSRWPLKDAKLRTLSAREGDYMARGLTVARVEVPGLDGGVLVGSTHWTTSNRTGRQSLEASGVIAEMSAFAGPVIFGGDTNARPEYPVMDELVDGMAARGKPVLDAFAAVGEGEPETFSATRPFARIDYVFASSALNPVSARVLREARASDHLPLFVQYAIGPAPLASGQAFGLLGISSSR